MKSLIRILSLVAMSLGILVLAVLFIFPTRDTKEESQAAFRGLRKSVYDMAYDDGRLVDMQGVALDDSDHRLLQLRNPDTGRAYTEAEVRRLKHLRKRFPNNRLLPRARSAEEQAREAEEQSRLKRIEGALARRQASGQEIQEYYNVKAQALREWKELLEYVVHEENWSPAVREKYERMLKETARIEKRIETQRQRTLALHGGSR